MARLVVFSVGSLCIALAAAAGLAGYTAAQLPDTRVVVVSGPAPGNWQAKLMSAALAPRPRITGCAARGKPGA